MCKNSSNVDDQHGWSCFSPQAHGSNDENTHTDQEDEYILVTMHRSEGTLEPYVSSRTTRRSVSVIGADGLKAHYSIQYVKVCTGYTFMGLSENMSNYYSI